MDDRRQDLELPETTRLRPASLGRGLPVPPVIPMVAVLGLVFGLALGVGLARQPEPSPAPLPSLAAVADSTPSPSAMPSTAATNGVGRAVDAPPGAGYSLAKVLRDLQRPGAADLEIISARVGHYPAVSTEWVWLVVVPFSVDACGNHWVYGPFPGPSLTPCDVRTTTEMFIIDYSTGAFLEDRIPADTTA